MEGQCSTCGWPLAETRVLSTHHTSQGWVRYRRCACGEVSIELVTLATDPARSGPLQVKAVHDVAGLPG